MAPAFKEWQVIVEALGAGAQILILRKGGIAEGRGGFAVKASRFWLFPTQFHAQRENTKPAAARWFLGAATIPAPSADIALRYHAEIVHAAFLPDWEPITRLDPFHLWTEETLRERFDWSKPPGLHALIVRVHRIREPITITPTAEMAGCKSWVELPFRFEDYPSEPVLDDDTFARRRDEIAAVVPMATA